MSEPALDHFPFRIWSRLVARHSTGVRRGTLNYGSPMGDLAFRQTLAAYLRTARAVRCEAEQIMVVSGSQQALEIAARVLLQPGQPAWVEEPGYGGARDARVVYIGTFSKVLYPALRGWLSRSSENSGTPYPTPHDNPAKARDPVGRVGRLSCVWCPRNPARQTNGV
jgi:DNA-binding transcriptional MocR family regulator